MLIGIVGVVTAYICFAGLSFVSYLLSPLQNLSLRIRLFAEKLLCYSIRFLLRLQPWLQCRCNIPRINDVYDKIGSRKVIFVANHRSNLDTFLLISYIPGLRGLAKKELYYNIFFAPMMWLMGFIPVKKGDFHSFLRGLEKVKKQILGQNKAFLVFPETTRAEKGFKGVKKFSSSPFQLAVDTQALVVPIAIKNTDQLYGRGDLFLHPYQPVEVKMLAPLFPETFITGSVFDADRLRDQVWTMINQELQ
jgi:1-acyl-sn-glycerol-3-phosphate acyltransferase